MCVCGAHVWMCVHVGEAGLDVTPAVGMNRVSGRALQQAAAACSHCKHNSLICSKASRNTTGDRAAPYSAPYHHLLSLQLLISSTVAPLSKGLSHMCLKGSIKWADKNIKKELQFPFLLSLNAGRGFQTAADWESLGIWLVGPVYALLLCGRLPCTDRVSNYSLWQLLQVIQMPLRSSW